VRIIMHNYRKTIQIIFPPYLQTIDADQMLSIGWKHTFTTRKTTHGVALSCVTLRRGSGVNTA